MDLLTKSAHFLSIHTNSFLEKLVELYITEIERLHGMTMSVVSNNDPRFWKTLHVSFGVKLNFSTTFHPLTNSQLERVIQILNDMLRACIIDFENSWEWYFSLVEYSDGSR